MITRRGFLKASMAGGAVVMAPRSALNLFNLLQPFDISLAWMFPPSHALPSDFYSAPGVSLQRHTHCVVPTMTG